MKPFRAPRKTGDKTQVKSSQAKKYSPQKNKQTRQQPISDSEEATELGLVWPPPAVKDVDVGEQPSNPWWPQEPSNVERKGHGRATSQRKGCDGRVTTAI